MAQAEQKSSNYYLSEPIYHKEVSVQVSTSERQTKAVLDLTAEGNTVHFIARYRKEATSNLDEEVIRNIIEAKTQLEKLYSSKLTALKGIDEQGKLSDQLKSQIKDAKTLTEVEDLYAPYKRKRKTKADVAREKGFEPIAKQIKNHMKPSIPSDLLSKYSKDEILSGAEDIISQEIADSTKAKSFLREFYTKRGVILSQTKKKINEDNAGELHKFKIYETFACNVSRVKGYQILAINRGENLGLLTVSLDKNKENQDFIQRYYRAKDSETHLISAIKEGYKKLFASIEREVRKSLTEKAELEAINIFQKNLTQLLMLKPHYNQTILAIDPGFRTGCKIAVLNKATKAIEFSKIYLHKEEEAKQILTNLILKHSPNTIVVGNGTASKETTDLLSQITEIPTIIVNESGASVYSTSEIGRKEFPDLDATDRGTISIGRRYIDCLSEIVKVPVISIGVGMYQHDVNQKQLEIKLKETVEDVVNLVGINLNTASEYLLSYVSGLTKAMAKKITTNAPYNSRDELRKVLSAKAFQQAVGFLRCPESDNPLDNTSIHPEQYKLASLILANPISSFSDLKDKLEEINSEVTAETFNDIKLAHAEAGKELRHFEGTQSKKSKTIEELKEGDKVEGVVRNIMPFGAFVDIGAKQNALVHISEIANQFIKDPAEILTIGQEIKAKVINLDKDKGKIGISIKQLEE